MRANQRGICSTFSVPVSLLWVELLYVASIPATVAVTSDEWKCFEYFLLIVSISVFHDRSPDGCTPRIFIVETFPMGISCENCAGN